MGSKNKNKKLEEKVTPIVNQDPEVAEFAKSTGLSYDDAKSVLDASKAAANFDSYNKKQETTTTQPTGSAREQLKNQLEEAAEAYQRATNGITDAEAQAIEDERAKSPLGITEDERKAVLAGIGTITGKDYLKEEAEKEKATQEAQKRAEQARKEQNLINAGTTGQGLPTAVKGAITPTFTEKEAAEIKQVGDFLNQKNDEGTTLGEAIEKTAQDTFEKGKKLAEARKVENEAADEARNARINAANQEDIARRAAYQAARNTGANRAAASVVGSSVDTRGNQSNALSALRSGAASTQADFLAKQGYNQGLEQNAANTKAGSFLTNLGGIFSGFSQGLGTGASIGGAI